MTYELAKELKEAGFPKKDFYVHTDDHPAVKKGSLLRGQGNAPTLSELIEACGEHFTMLVKKNGGWEAQAYRNETYNTFSWYGETCEIATARLYIALKKGTNMV